ncbi:MAG: hypothetical protein IKZ68_03355 [Bacilli bacterium]|nr:hypothetical protein [Bacilli bacterium]
MNKKSKTLFIASLVTFFLPLIVAIPFSILALSQGIETLMSIAMVASLLPGLLLFLFVPLAKRHYYKKKEERGQRKIALIITAIQGGAPFVIELICFIALVESLSAYPSLLTLRILYLVSYIPFLVLNILFWASFPKEEEKEV